MIGKVKGSEYPDAWVLAGNHRDAWVYGAVDPSSGTAAMLEAVHGIGALMKQGWRPKRTMLFCSWDGEEEGLIGSTEWVEQHAEALERPSPISTWTLLFQARTSLRPPCRRSSSLSAKSRARCEPAGRIGLSAMEVEANRAATDITAGARARRRRSSCGRSWLGLGLYAVSAACGRAFADMGSDGPYGVYHSTFDDFAWFTVNADPHFVYLQEMARVLGLEAIRMADADVLPYDYVTYARQISAYLGAAKQKAAGVGMGGLDFAAAEQAAGRLAEAAGKAQALETAGKGNTASLNAALRQTETAFISAQGLPRRPWYRHTIYAPGEYTGYEAVVIPGVNEAIDARDAGLAAAQLGVLTEAIDRAARTLEAAGNRE